MSYNCSKFFFSPKGKDELRSADIYFFPSNFTDRIICNPVFWKEEVCAQQLKSSLIFSLPKLSCCFLHTASALISPGAVGAATSCQGLLVPGCCRHVEWLSDQWRRPHVKSQRLTESEKCVGQTLLFRYRGHLPDYWGCDGSSLITTSVGWLCSSSFSPPLFLSNYHLYIHHVPTAQGIVYLSSPISLPGCRYKTTLLNL